MDIDKNKLRKIKALLAKEGATGTTPEEVAAAIAMATRLLEREGLTRESLSLLGDSSEEEQPGTDPQPLASGGKVSLWRRRLANCLASSFGCFIYHARIKGRASSIVLVGRTSDTQVVRYLFEYCSREIDRLTKANCTGFGKNWSNGYRNGCVDAIFLAIYTEREAERAAQRAACTSTALVVLEGAIARLDARSKEAELSTQIKFGREPKVKNHGSNFARMLGQQDGANIYPGKGGKTELETGAAGKLED